jgi:hypothetical protein
MPDRYTRRPRRFITAALAIATLGAAIPYGTATGGTTSDVTVLEIVLSALALVAALGLIADLIPHLNPTAYALGLAHMVAGFMWMSVAVYVLLLPHLTLLWRLGHALPSLGWAVLALTTWRWVVTSRRRAVHLDE